MLIESVPELKYLSPHRLLHWKIFKICQDITSEFMMVFYLMYEIKCHLATSYQNINFCHLKCLHIACNIMFEKLNCLLIVHINQGFH